MKRITTIVQSLVLSMLIIALGGGVALVTCCRSNTTQLALLSGMEGSDNQMSSDGCCGEMAKGDMPCKMDKACKAMPMKSCMTVKVMKLAPSTVASHLYYHFQNISILIANIEWDTVSVFRPMVVRSLCRDYQRRFISPPRAYLHLLRVLII